MNSLVELLYQLVTYVIGLLHVLSPIVILIFAWHIGKSILGKLTDRALDTLLRKKRFKKMGSNITREDMLPVLSVMHPREFEYYVADLLEKNGHRAKVVGGHGRGDGGIDIIAKKDGKLVYVQCKKFIGKDIGVSAVRDFYGAIADSVHENSARGYFITTSNFTNDAISFAKGKDLRLIDGDELIDIIFSRELRGEKVGLGEQELSGVMRQTPPDCPVCRKRLVWRKGPTGTFLGCRGYPACRYIYAPPQIEKRS